MAQGALAPRLAGMRQIRERARSIPFERWLPWVAFIAVVGLSFGLNSWQLSGNGYGNTFYAAAARSMAGSWKNFFFGSFDPGGFITVDKPPVFLWVDALSVRAFGYSSWSLLLPSAIAGAATVALVWLAVRRYFGVFAATVAGLVLALTPITVAVDRLNLPEPFYILALVGAAYAVLRSLEARRWWAWLVLAGVLVGIAFNTKMLAAWIPGPAMALAIVAGYRGSWRLRPLLQGLLPRLAVLAVVTLAVSASWGVVVDAWPASSRPYIGGSTNNTVTNLALGYNGFGRIDGNEQPARGGGGGGGGPSFGGNGGANRSPRPNRGFNGGTPPSFNGSRPGGSGNNGFGGFGGAQPRGGTNTNAPTPGASATGAGGIIAGTPGLLRMLDDANGDQIAWFLPFALLGSLLCLWQWRKDRVRRATTVLFLGWVLLFAYIFSTAQGIYHSYYTSALAPGIAVLAGMSAAATIALARKNPRWLLTLAPAVVATVWVQLVVTGRFPGFRTELRPIAVAVVVAGGVFLLGYLVRRRVPLTAGMTVVFAGLLLLPASWTTYEATHASLNTTLPQAGPRQGAAGSSFGSAAFDDGTASLAAWLEAHRDPNARWDLAVSSAQDASTLIAEYQLSVMALGGFLGTDPTITVAQFAGLVANGDVRYVLAEGGFGGIRLPSFLGIQNGSGQSTTTLSSTAKGASVVMSAVEQVCTGVTSSSLPTRYQGSLYDCSGKAAALEALVGE